MTINAGIKLINEKIRRVSVCHAKLNHLQPKVLILNQANLPIYGFLNK